MAEQQNTPKLELQDLSIVLAARNHNPGMLTPDFLNGSGVIPSEWELARPPVLTQRSTQIMFKNGVRIEAQPGTVSFSQGIGNNKNVEISGVAMKYAATLQNLEYQGVGINPRRFVTFENQPDGAHNYLTEKILSHGSWQNFGTAPVQAGINLVYTLEDCQLRLAINEARLKLPDREIPAVVFGGNFSYNIVSDSAEERLRNLNRVVENWQRDVERFRELVEGQFLAGVKEEPVFVVPAGSL